MAILPFGFPVPKRGIAPAAKREHEIAIIVADREIRGFTDYQIDVGLLEPADTFQMSLPFDRVAWSYVRADRRIKITIDGTVILEGFLDSRKTSSGDGIIKLAGRDKVGRLVQESAPQVSYQGKLLTALVAELAAPWFTRVVLSNARNRRVMRTAAGRKKSAKLAADSGRVWLDSKVGTRIDPGQMRWAVIEDLCAQAGYLCWSSADGTELIIGQPDYQQEIQYRFFQAPFGGAIARPTSPGLLDVTVEESTADRYSRIIVLGAGAGTDSNFGITAASRSGQAKNNPATADGDGKDFSAPKRLILANRDDVKSHADAAIVARHEMARRDMDGHPLSVTCATHGQLPGSTSARVLFVPDTMASVEDSDRDVRGSYWVTGCSYRAGRDTGETTLITLLPAGTEVVP